MPTFIVLVRPAPDELARSYLVRAEDTDHAADAVQRREPGAVVGVGACSTELAALLKLELREVRQL